MNPFFEDTTTQHRAILTNSKEVAALGEKANVISTRWYDEVPPMNELIIKAKSMNKDVITIETQVITEKSYEVL